MKFRFESFASSGIDCGLAKGEIVKDYHRVRRDNRRAIWTKGRLVRSIATCANCSREMTKGDVCYRPITNALYRGARVCVPCVQAGMTHVAKNNDRNA